MARMLTRFDEFPRHQTIATFDTVANPLPQWSDGYYFTLGGPEGEAALFTAIRLYPNNNVIDAYACVSLVDGKQHNVRYSRRLRPRIDDLDVGPFSMEILEGLKTIRIGLDENPHGVSFDLRWDGFAPCYNEVHEPRYLDGRLVSDRANYLQVGNVSGTLTVKGREFAVDDRWSGVRDHSWGVGDTGGPAYPNAAPPTERGKPFGLRQWVGIRFPGRAVYFQFHQDGDGTTTMFESRVEYPYGDRREGYAYTGVRVLSVEFQGGLRRLKRAELAFTKRDGSEERFGMETISRPVYMGGAGYWGGWNDGFGRGAYRGELADEGESWDVSHPVNIGYADGSVKEAPRFAWAESWGRFWNLDDPTETGTGHLECVIAGPYPGIGG